MASGLNLKLKTVAFDNIPTDVILNSSASGKKITKEVFGMHNGHIVETTIWGEYSQSARDNYVQIPLPDNMNLGSFRLWDCDGCSWRNINRSNGTYVWTRLDYVIGKCIEKGLSMIYTLGCGPDWATTLVGQKAGLYVGYNPHPPKTDQIWIDWCTAIATRYKGLGITYEIWNEVNDQSYGAEHVGSGFVGSISTLKNLAKLAYQTIKAIDSTAKIMTPNFVGESGLVAESEGKMCLDDYLGADTAQYADIISVHGYNTLSPWTYPEGVIEYGKRVKQILKKYNLNLPVWNTEWGFGRWTDSTGTMYSHPNSMSDIGGSDYVTRMILLSWCAGFDRFYFYGYDAHFSYSTILFLNTTSKPYTQLRPAFAYQYLSSLLIGGYCSGFQKLTDASKNAYYKVNITTADGKSGKVLWTPGWLSAVVDTSSASAVNDNIGTSIAKSTTTSLSHSPIFVWN